MIPASFYYTVYLFVVLLLTIISLSKYTNKSFVSSRTSVAQSALSRNIAILLALYIGFRPLSEVFDDMVGYEELYSRVQDGNGLAILAVGNLNYIFDPIFILFASIGLSVDFFFFFIACIYFGGIYWACKRLYPLDTMLAFVTYLGAFSTFSYATNGIKAGAAAALFLVALSYYKQKRKMALFLFLTLGFHHAMVIPIAACFCSCVIKNRKIFFCWWVVCFVMALLHVTVLMSIFASLTDDHGAEYLQAGKELIVSGFRIDFIVYSVIPIIVGNFVVRKYDIRSDEFDFLLNTYTMTNSIFLLCTYGSYINRMAYLSWLMYSIVLLYPFLNVVWSNKHKQVKFLKYVVWGHLGFTLFMIFVYYA